MSCLALCSLNKTSDPIIFTNTKVIQIRCIINGHKSEIISITKSDEKMFVGRSNGGGQSEPCSIGNNQQEMRKLQDGKIL